MKVKDALGRFGEDVAARHLERAGLVLVERNWRCREGEIDIVARDGAVLVFCEVKTRSRPGFGSPGRGGHAGQAAPAAACWPPAGWPPIREPLDRAALRRGRRAAHPRRRWSSTTCAGCI